ncbi:MAG TPA: zf-HC2 domain-containing protein [Longimicrobiales bacterium]|nr:zf-HC2 domain-containing protein [Longimicrobiales bacterium]
MTCSEFIEGFSEYYDGVASASSRREAEEHLAVCRDCRRYVKILDRGRELLRSFPAVEVTGDFAPRLEHRIYHLKDGEALRRGMAGSASGATAATALGMAVLLVFAAWSPVLVSAVPEVELSPIVVSRPETRPAGLRTPPVSLLPLGGSIRLDRPDPWGQPNALLFRHSPLYSRTHSLLRRTELE